MNVLSPCFVSIVIIITYSSLSVSSKNKVKNFLNNYQNLILFMIGLFIIIQYKNKFK